MYRQQMSSKMKTMDMLNIWFLQIKKEVLLYKSIHEKEPNEKPSTGINFIWVALLFYNVLISVVSKHERKRCVYFEKA